MENSRLAAAFDELADLLELAAESPFKTRAYRAFAERARTMHEPLSERVARGDLGDLPGVGEAIAAKVEAFLADGTFAALEKARATVPSTLRELLKVPGLGAKSVRTLWKEAAVTTLGELVHACEENRLATVSGFGTKKQARTLAVARVLLEGSRGALLSTALEAGHVIGLLLRAVGAEEVVVAGEARRGLEIVKELTVLAQGIDVRVIAAALDGAAGLGTPRVRVSRTDVTLAIHGLSTRVRAVSDEAWVHSQILETGSAAHVTWLAERARARGLTLPGVCAGAGDEAAVYRALDLPFAPPELRAGAVDHVPEGLVARPHVRGVFHVHTDWSDGTASILEMARAAARESFEYVGISDHSCAASYANGLDAARLREQGAAIEIARREIPGCTILHGVEVDILPDGSLDLDNDTLASLDFVIASVHGRFAMSYDEMTARIVRAVSHPLVTILGHPTGRLLLGRQGYAFDVEAVARAAAANGTYLEINANPQRLDLSDALVRRAALEGAEFAIDPDAHGTVGLRDTRLGVVVARRAGLTRDKLLNTRGRDELVAKLAARKAAALGRLDGRRAPAPDARAGL